MLQRDPKFCDESNECYTPSSLQSSGTMKFTKQGAMGRHIVRCKCGREVKTIRHPSGSLTFFIIPRHKKGESP